MEQQVCPDEQQHSVVVGKIGNGKGACVVFPNHELELVASDELRGKVATSVASFVSRQLLV